MHSISSAPAPQLLKEDTLPEKDDVYNLHDSLQTHSVDGGSFHLLYFIHPFHHSNFLQQFNH